MKIIETALPGVLIIEPKVFGDERGYFMESWQQQRYRDIGIERDFVQSNVSKSAYGVLRGLHFQNPNPQGKLVSVLVGEVYDVAVDIRHGSPTFGQYVGVTLSAENHRQFYVPEGFAHGFCVTSENAIFNYMCTDYYHAESEASIAWNDKNIGIDWPIDEPKLSAKDQAANHLSDYPLNKLPTYQP
ncbi:dTDP-4-dehydrorhamnose 3,5-epimerase [Marinicella pacifica]|uniref:dTDP-4-dehydrorhamnose 3,5-epimerase n=1 Tax=Marinicella pacifica TaxID=1171543 RepID=A0A917CWF3_9GAMM|nr:dTDP-4-dehydrorhamnose 3,5-epimerase [Marinicella pacifica]GGF98108.1 dTDP-4-dehydrorhamnose 3,5-epimerase [Marinicella pacifica]